MTITRTALPATPLPAWQASGKSMRAGKLALIAALLSAQATLGIAIAEEPSNQPSAFTELEDGTLVAYRSTRSRIDVVRYAHEAARVASACIELDEGRDASRQRTHLLINRCDFPVTLSYCIGESSTGSRRCEAIGRRNIDSITVAAKSSMKVGQAMGENSEVRWVACRGEPGTVSSLTANGTRGECLAEDSNTQLASSRRVGGR